MKDKHREVKQNDRTGKWHICYRVSMLTMSGSIRPGKYIYSMMPNRGVIKTEENFYLYPDLDIPGNKEGWETKEAAKIVLLLHII